MVFKINIGCFVAIQYNKQYTYMYNLVFDWLTICHLQ